jgi:hypothetical protein
VTDVAIDYDGIFGDIDYDPCAALAALRPAYMKLRAGGGVAEITFRDRTTKFHAAELKEFGALIAQLESECAAKQGRRPKRLAITAGYRRDFGC